MALANAGAEAEEPTIALPAGAAAGLGLEPSSAVKVREFSTETLGHLASGKVRVELLS